MLYRIGASRKHITDGTLAANARGGFWASINARNGNEAVKMFFQKHVEELWRLREFHIYQIKEDTSVCLMNYYVEDIAFEAPDIVF